MSDFDILIVGGGIAGASLGAEVAAKRRTLIVEAEEHCGFHSTGRSAAFFLESYGGPVVSPLSAASADFLGNPPRDFAQAGFLRHRGALHLSQDGWPEIPGVVEARRVHRDELERILTGLKPRWTRALFEPGCADIDVAALHAAFLRRFRRSGGTVRTGARLVTARPNPEGWTIALADGTRLSSGL